MTNLKELKKGMRIPVIGAPMFIISNPKLVIEQCKEVLLAQCLH